MKKVLIMSSVHLWNDTRVFHKEAVSLANLGYDVTLYAAASNHVYENNIPNLQVITFAPKSKVQRWQIWIKLYSIARNSDAEIVHLHDPELLPLGYILKKIHRKKVIFDMHEDFPAVLQTRKIGNMSVPKWLLRFISTAEKKMLQKMSAVIYAEKYYKENYETLTVKQLDIYNYPFLQETLEIEKYEIPTLIYAGAIHEIRGFKEMLAVAQLLKKDNYHFQLLIVGKVPERLDAYAKQFLHENDLADKVKLVGRLDLHELMTFYAKSHIGLAILHPEANYLRSLPTKVFEYMSVSLPYVLSNFDSYERLVAETKSGYAVNPLVPSEIAAQVKVLLDTPEKQTELGTNGYRQHVANFNWSIEERKLGELYEGL
ncbi:glycosyltransferase family 4 protein [Listeria newyorkensis]|uniref:Glycosyltransferase family 4 protein n=1 Tax=Listeria newyorkensis TaxID=1497681 RepID=A0A841YVM8_9LIST|nr:glycosyltransferase family 4 protein [Listeria newyorkensis]MBC1457149.1 glycosyltransferase family 4 protein [Listeria newyorkensis]